MRKKNYETVVCADGFEMSVQASRGHYCRPREDAGPYTAVEIGFPNRRDELLMPHIELADQPPLESVYPYVPANVVMEVILKHGGRISGELPPLNLRGA